MTLRAFYASPFASKYRWIRNAIAQACRQTGIELRAVDEMAFPGESIPDRIIDEIEHADLCIAVISGLNPNVMYELGRAQQASKPTILLADEKTFATRPFDLRTFSTIKYDGSERNERDLATVVAAAIGAVKNALTDGGFRTAIASGQFRSQALAQVGRVEAEHGVFTLDFEQIRRDAEHRMGKKDCKTVDIEAKKFEGFKGWHQTVSCPCGDDLLIVVDLNGSIVRTRVK